MIEFLLSAGGVLILTLGGFYVWSKLLNKKVNFKNYKFYLTVILLSFISIFNYSNVSAMIRVVFIMLFMSTVVKFVFNVSFKESIVTVFYNQLINIIGELIYSILLIVFFNKSPGVYPLPIIFCANIFVTTFTILIINIKFIRKIYNSIINFIKRLSLKLVLICLLPIFFIVNVYLAITYYEYNPIYYVIINNISIFLIFLIIFILIRKENDYFKIYNKYNTTLNSLKEYEDILDKYRVSNHENKNQLLTIRNMLSVKNKKIISYIDEIVENKLKDDEKIMHEVTIIPAGGLRGLIYSKLLYMKEKNIEYELNISKDVKTVDLINELNESNMLDICKIIGVYIDNAIDAVLNLEKKYVNVEMYFEDNNLVFSICNYYVGTIEIDKIEEKGYTTKGISHGYGLSLAREIINNNKNFKNEKRLSKDTFTQILKIKMK